MAERKKKRPPQRGAERGMGGILKGLGDLAEKLVELAESGRELSKRGEIRGAGKKLKGICGFTVKVGLGDEGPTLEPFGNIRRDVKSGRTEVHEVRIPAVDIFEEEDHLLAMAELPGIAKEDVKIEIKEDVLLISAERGDRKYRKEVLLPRDVTRGKLLVSCKNGILEIKCPK
jgi:HSP20 family protein